MSKKPSVYDYYKPIQHVPLLESKTALLVIDMQYIDASPDFGVFARAHQEGHGYLFDYYFQRLQHEVIPNTQLLLHTFRELQAEVIFTKIESLTANGRDRSTSHKLLGVHAPKYSREGQILESVSPQPDEMVISKTASGAFGTTNIDYVLRNLGIEMIVVTGVFTNECVENTVRTAADMGFVVAIAEDAVAALTPELHDGALSTLGHSYAQVMKTHDIVRQMRSYAKDTK